jgi:chorismate mutase/prephenate dehydratase
MNLDDLREKIDQIDRDLVRLLNERARVAEEVGKVKNDTDQEFYVPGREQRVFEKVVGLSDGPLNDNALRAIYREIMSAALALEQRLIIAHFGQPGTFTHQAAREKFGSSVDYEPCNTIAEVFAAVQNRAASYGVVPIENSTEGAVNATLDELIETPLKIYAEVFMGVSHNLLSNAPREGIRRIYSHPQVLGQCRQWLAEHFPGVETIPHASTAKAAETAAREEGSAAVASALAAEIHTLTVLHRNIQDQAGNTTRFLVLGPRFGPPTGRDKTSIVFTVRHKVGALYDALSSFKAHGLNMTKIESRPSRGKAWEYYFFVDMEGHIDNPEVKSALDALDAHCLMLNVLGSYPMADPARNAP